MSGAKRRERAGGTPSARSITGPPPPRHAGSGAASQARPAEERLREDGEMMSAQGSRVQTQPLEGVAVVGEAIRRVEPESAEFLVEITAGGASGTQAIHNHHTKTAQIAQAVSALGVQRADLQTVSLNV